MGKCVHERIILSAEIMLNYIQRTAISRKPTLLYGNLHLLDYMYTTPVLKKRKSLAAYRQSPEARSFTDHQRMATQMHPPNSLGLFWG